MADDTTPATDPNSEQPDAEGEGVTDRLRDDLRRRVHGMGVGSEDPNIIGDAEGGIDVAPGSDPPKPPAD